MPELDEQESTPLVAPRSRKLTVAAMLLAILPPLLPFPLGGLVRLWIGPLDSAAWQQCHDFYCPQAADVEHLATLLVLGPSLLIAVVAIVFSFKKSRLELRNPGSEEVGMLLSLTCMSIIWAVFLGIIMWFYWELAGGTL
ncbi:MAG TPA: hypothetical protein VH540_15995 [Ktedonobacterales bacterium]|jgi:hypothetical protein